MSILKITCFGLLISFALYGQILSYAFTQDDFFILKQARFNTFLQQVRASLPQFDSIYFRPLGIQLYFWFAWRLFGLNPTAYRIVALVLHAINAALVYFLIRKIAVEKSWVVWFLYLTAPLHFVTIGWVGNINFILGTFLVLLTLLLAIDARTHSPIVILMFLISILTNELAVVMPGLLIILLFTSGVKRKKFIQNIILPLCFLDIAYLVFRLATPRATTGAYEIGFGWHIAQNIRWLFLWVLGLAEPIKDYFINLWSIRSDFVMTFPAETAIQAVALFLFCVFVFLGALRTRQCWLGMLFFLIAIFPVLGFRRHISPHYAAIGSIGIFLAIAIGLRRLPHIITYGLMAVWFLQVLAVMRIHFITHWWVQHALLSASLQQQLQERYPTLPDSKKLFITSKQPDRVRVVLAGDNAAQLLYNDPDATVVYLSE